MGAHCTVGLEGRVSGTEIHAVFFFGPGRGNTSASRMGNFFPNAHTNPVQVGGFPKKIILPLNEKGSLFCPLWV